MRRLLVREVEALRQMGEAPGGREALQTIFGYLCRVAGDEQRASVPELERWAERVLEADALDDVWD